MYEVNLNNEVLQSFNRHIVHKIQEEDKNGIIQGCVDDGVVLEETKVLSMLDKVYPSVEIGNIDYSGVAFMDGEWCLKKLYHKTKSVLTDVLDIDSVVCVTETDAVEYWQSNKSGRLLYEIPAGFRSIAHRHLRQENGVYIIPEKAYDDELGLIMERATPENYKAFEFL